VKSYIILAILFAGLFSSGCTNLYIENIPDKGKWIVAEDEMTNPRNIATANLLPDGNVLIMGGSAYNAADTAEVFNPKQMKIIKTIPLTDKREYGYISQTLNNGDVFVAGGNTGFVKTASAKIFDSKTYTFRNIKPIQCRRDFYINAPYVLLNNGNVLFLINSQGIIYDSKKEDYYKTNNTMHKLNSWNKVMILKNGDVLFPCYTPMDKKDKGSEFCLYNYAENKFEKHENYPTGRLFVQLDSESYLVVNPHLTYSSGYTYNIKTKVKTPVKNTINRTWRLGVWPDAILLKNGNVLILGIILKNSSDEYENSHKNRQTSKYSAYIYDRNKNKFYEIQPPPFPVYEAGIVMLKNGDVLIAGGLIRYNKFSKKIQIYRYKH